MNRFYNKQKLSKLTVITTLIIALLIGASFVVQAGDNGGNTLDFDGSNDYVALDNSILNGGSYTKEAWVYARAASCNNILSSFDNTQLWVSNRLYGGHNSSYGVVQDSVNFPLNSWQHVAVTYDQPSTTMRLYRNGVEVGSNTAAPAYTHTQPLHVGAHGIGCTWNGMIEDVRIWDHARALSEIQADMYGELTGSENGLLAYYRFSDGAGSSTVTDDSGNGHQGTLANMSAASDWIASTAPIGDSTVNAQTDIAGFWIVNNPSSSSGLSIANSSFLNQVGDDIIFGHNNLTGNSGQDLPVTWPGGANEARWGRVWYCDLNDQPTVGGAVNLTFDFNAASMGAFTPSAPASNYRLLERSGTSGDFTDIATATSVDSGAKTVTFNDVSVGSVCSYITLGTLDNNVSPTAVTLQSISATSQVGWVGLLVGLLALGLAALRLRRPR
ncbi:MAG: LamG domain-containing protein [Ardenticatenaceae bacterium]|nr:LamG domain-containing protein [Ardenticatenaceae bacterium]